MHPWDDSEERSLHVHKMDGPGLRVRGILNGIGRFLFGENDEVHYIGGAEVLPPPLDAGEESVCIRMLATDAAEEARRKLIEHNLRLVVYIAKKFDNTGVGVEDLISIGTIGLIKAINTFIQDKNIKPGNLCVALYRK